MKKRKLPNPVLLDKDIEILQFLWRHRIATFQALKFIFYPELAARQAYRKLTRLHKGEYICVEKIIGTTNRAWCLGYRGYEYLKQNILPELKNNKYKSQSQFHDLIVTSVLLGRWLKEKPNNIKFITEQELATTDVEILPKDLRKEIKHMPDGLWIFESGKEPFAIALEVEPSAKTSDRYEDICSFYSSQIFFKHIVWIVQSKRHAIRILESSRMYGIPREGIHLFIDLDDFKKFEWDSFFLNESMKEITLGKFLGEMANVKVPQFLQNGAKIDSTSGVNAQDNTTKNQFLNFTLSLDKFNTSQKV